MKDRSDFKLEHHKLNKWLRVFFNRNWLPRRIDIAFETKRGHQAKAIH